MAGGWAQSSAPKAPAASAGPKLAEEEFKNIQALKGIPADQVIPSMQFIAASLGVECEFCHVAHANEKDDKKPKVTARRRMRILPRRACERKGRQEAQSHRAQDDRHDDGDQ